VDVNLQTESEISKSTIVVMYVFKKNNFLRTLRPNDVYISSNLCENQSFKNSLSKHNTVLTYLFPRKVFFAFKKFR